MAEPARVQQQPESRDAVTELVRRRFSSRSVVVAAVTIAATLWGLWWLVDRLTNVYVLDARIAAEMVLISSRVPGWVTGVPVHETQRVARGDVLLTVDSRTATARYRELDAAVEVRSAEIVAVHARIRLVEQRTQSRLDASRAQLDAAHSELAAAHSDFEMAEADWKRAGPLRERNLLSQQEWESDRNIYRNAEQNTHRREAQVAIAEAEVAEAQAERAELAVLDAELLSLEKAREQKGFERERAQSDLQDHTITSPIEGVIDELFIDAGEYVAPGQRLLVMHDPHRIWVKANVKETDIRFFVSGKPVQIVVDAYPSETRAGTVRQVGAAATSQFALLPNLNPSGNFTKITQRVEVTVELDAFDARLIPGMMVEVKIPKGE